MRFTTTCCADDGCVIVQIVMASPPDPAEPPPPQAARLVAATRAAAAVASTGLEPDLLEPDLLCMLFPLLQGLNQANSRLRAPSMLARRNNSRTRAGHAS